jgi:DnaJ-class molecular chaperone
VDATKDYYAVIGVPESASKQEIKSAFRKLAKELHPDRNPGDKKAAARFREVNEAYTVLENDKDRARYDRLRRLGVGLDFPGGAAYDLNDIKDKFAEQFSGLGDLFSGIMGGGAGEGGRRGRDLTYKVAISLDKSLTGGKATFSVPGLKGKGTRKIRVDLPPGLKPGQKIRLDGQGKPGSGGGPPGDLFLKVTIKDSGDFRLDGDRVVHEARLNLRQLVLGSRVEVPLPAGGHAKLDVPAGTQVGTKFRLKGQAGPDRDLYVVVLASIPKDLSDDAGEAFARFCDAAGIPEQ